MSDDVATPRASGTLAVFQLTCDEVLGKLAEMPPSEEAIDYKRAAQALAAQFRAWEIRPPEPEERATVVSRLMDLHRAVSELAARR
jgi:acyl-CoA reductase-like NAD-dependent aldehyde dehydrogenase